MGFVEVIPARDFYIYVTKVCKVGKLRDMKLGNDVF